MILILALIFSDVTGASGRQRVTTPITMRADGSIAFGPEGKAVVLSRAQAHRELDRIFDDLKSGKRKEAVQIHVQENSDATLLNPISERYDPALLRLTMMGMGARKHGRQISLASGTIEIAPRLK
jgi:hypothetical protein